jgi:hypothetical protein
VVVEPAGRQAARVAANNRLAELGWSAARLSEESGLDPGTVLDFLNGVRWPRRQTLAALSGWRRVRSPMLRCAGCGGGCGILTSSW